MKYFCPIVGSRPCVDVAKATRLAKVLDDVVVVVIKSAQNIPPL